MDEPAAGAMSSCLQLCGEGMASSGEAEEHTGTYVLGSEWILDKLIAVCIFWKVCWVDWQVCVRLVITWGHFGLKLVGFWGIDGVSNRG